MMRLRNRLCGAAVALILATTVQAEGSATYDLLFRNGTLDMIARDTALEYHRDVTNALIDTAAARDTGDIVLSFDGGLDGSAPLKAKLKFEQGDKYRNLGTFPASVGNPIIMYFVETVVRDMTESAGGSPFYIRNRVKEALVTPTDIVAGETQFGDKMIPTQTVILRPFAEDPNRDRMVGFGDLALTITMSDDVPGWYHSLSAMVAGAEAPIYSSKLQFIALEAPQ